MRAWPIAAATVAALLLLIPAAGASAQEDGSPSAGDEGADEDAESAQATDDPRGSLERPAGATGAARRVAVVILASSGVDPETADALTELMIGAVARRGRVTIIGKEEFQAQLGQGEARSAECVSSTACLGRVGVQLNVDEMIAGTVARRGDRWVFNLNRIDIRSGELAGRAFREVPGDLGDLADALQEALPELYEPTEDPGALIVSASVAGAEVVVDGVLVGIYRDEPVRLENVAPGRHELLVTKGGYFEWSRTLNVGEGRTIQIDAALTRLRDADEGPSISPLLWVGLGVGAVFGGLAAYFGVSSQAEPDQMLTRADAVAWVDSRQTEATLANISMGLAAAGVATAIVGFILSDFGGADDDASDDEEALVPSVAPLRGGGMVALRGRLP